MRASVPKQKLVIWGASGHALVVADIIGLLETYEIVGFLDDINPDIYNTQFGGVTILGGKDRLDELRYTGVENIIFGFGDCEARLNLSSLVRVKGFQLATAIHPQSVVARNVPVGAGTVICAGAVVNPGSYIGENVIVNTCASVDHECVVEDGAHIGPGAHLGGKVSIGRASWIGIGATVKDRVVIGASSVIGAGAVVLQDIPKGVVAYGCPAKVVRKNNV